MAKKALSIAALKRFFWHTLLVVTLLGVFAASGLLWNAGRDDAKDSPKDGRRLVIRLDNGAIEGFQAKEQIEEAEAKDEAVEPKKGGEVELHEKPEADKTADAKSESPKDSKADSKEKAAGKEADKKPDADKANDTAVKEEPKKPEPTKEEPKKEEAAAREEPKEETKKEEAVKEEPKKEEPQKEVPKEEPKEDPKADNAADQQNIKAISGSLVPSLSAVREAMEILCQTGGIYRRLPGNRNYCYWAWYKQGANRSSYKTARKYYTQLFALCP